MHHFDLARWTFDTVPSERSIALPTYVVVALAPILGAAFLMFMPFIGFYLLAMALIGKLLRNAPSLAPQIVVPGESYLTGGQAEGFPTADERLDALAEKVRVAREQGDR